jgi:hypothetical protein
MKVPRTMVTAELGIGDVGLRYSVTTILAFYHGVRVSLLAICCALSSF